MSAPESAEQEAVSTYRRALREYLIAVREAMSPVEHAAKSRRIEKALLSLLRQLAPRTVGFCWPHRGEFDARPLIGRWLAEEPGRRAALPVIVRTRAPMIFREWRPGTELRADRYGIPVPAAGEHLHPDLFLLPLVGFDRRGYRLGYGGGYFDRTLAEANPRPATVGVGFELARLDSIEPQPHDQPLDWLITESGARLGEK